ncbi:MAG TPA: hypothetical protein VJ279_08495 [Hanamia sp.]|jgi:hypothetical protein|nr:hypothetical protein [Hanamia sp.]
MDESVSCLVEISSPFDECNKNAGDSVHLNWLMERFGLGISYETFHKIFNKIVKEFHRNPEPHKKLEFTVSVKTLSSHKRIVIKEEKDLETDLIVNKLKFCGCGDPASVLELLFNFIQLSQLHRTQKPAAIQGKEWGDYCKKQREEKKQLIINHPEAIEWLIYYVLDEKDIFTHGGNVSGGWLDDYEFFNLLTEWNVKQSHVD